MSRIPSLRAASLAALSLALLACGDPTGPDPVTPPKTVASVVVSPSTHSVTVGQQVALQATPKAADGETLERAVTWESEDASVATVSASGIVTALAPGEVGIKAVSEQKVGRAVFTIAPVPVIPVAEVRLSVDDEVQLEWNGTKTVTATALDAGGNVLPGRAVTWQVNHPGIATITNGVIAAVSAGTATITATIEGIHSSVGVRVNDAPIVEMTIEGPDGLEVGEVAQFSAKVRRASGQTLYEPAVWTSSAPGVAVITHTEACCTVVEVLSVGQVTLTATKDGVSRTTTLRVSPRATADLIYSRYAGTASEIFTMTLAQDGLAPVKINAGNVSRDPSPSPDGTQLVFAVTQTTPLAESQNDLYIVNRNGLNMRWLTRTAGLEDEPGWSPDGSKILFRSWNDSRYDIYTINPDGTGITNVTAGLPAEMVKMDPSWSPDSRRIAFIGVTGSQYKVWTIGADGTDARQVTTDAGFDLYPSWSPDGQKIAFTRHNAATPSHGDDIMIVAATGGTPTRLSLPGDQRLPAWSPDGEYIAVAGTAVAGQGVTQIFTLRPDGTGLRVRTINPAWGGGSHPAWIKRQ